jgi:D-alanyl-D-alanine carboxypeptidase
MLSVVVFVTSDGRIVQSGMLGRPSCLLAVIAAIASSFAGRAPDNDFASRVEVIARHSLDRPNAGVSIAVARDGKLVLARAYGVADRSHGVDVTPDSIFHIASISKNIAAAAVLSLVDQGRVRLDDDVTRFVPAAPTHGQHVTIRQLLNHTSGIFSFTSFPGAEANEALDLTHAQILDSIKERAPDFAPGTSWRYDNTGFYLAGMVVEQVTGQPYGTYIRDRFFRPLGMSSSSLCTIHDNVPGLVSAFIRQDNALVPAPFMTWMLPFSAGSVCSTAIDLTRWQIALDSGQVLKPGTLALMRRPSELADGTRIEYGLGTRLGSFLGHRVLGHTGSGGGFTTVLEDFPDDRLTIAVLINTEAAGANAVAADIARAAFGVSEAPLHDLPAPARELAAIAGTFDSDDGPVNLFPCGEKLCFDLPGASVERRVQKRQAPFVYALDRDTMVRFIQRRGRVDWAFVYSAGLMIDARPRKR